MNNDISKEWLFAFVNNDMKKLKKLSMDENFNINKEIEVSKNKSITPLILAVENNNKELVEFLLCSTELKKNANINQTIGEIDDNICAISAAISQGNEEMVDFLLHSPKLKEHANLCPEFKILLIENVPKIKTYISQAPLKSAINGKEPAILEKILKEKEFIDKNLLVKEIVVQTFDKLLMSKNIKMINYLFIEKLLIKNKEIEKIIKSISKITNDNNFFNEVIKIMNNVELNNKLENNLVRNNNKHKKSKI